MNSLLACIQHPKQDVRFQYGDTPYLLKRLSKSQVPFKVGFISLRVNKALKQVAVQFTKLFWRAKRRLVFVVV